MNLKEIYLFENLDERQIGRLKELSYKKEYKKDNILFLEGDEPKSLYILTKGALKVYKTDFKGNEVVMKYFYPVSIIAELAHLDHIPYPATAVFETDAEVRGIDFKTFEEEFLKDPNIMLSIIRSLTKKLRSLEVVISRNLTMDSTSRVAKFVYENESLFLQLQQNKVASILNITPETLSRVVKKFKEDGIIESRNRKFTILDRERLKEFY